MKLSLQPGQRLHEFRLEAQHTSSAMATVYRALDTERARPVALKIVPRAHTPKVTDQLRRFRHPHVVPIEDVRHTPELSFLVMPWVPGPTLGQWLKACPQAAAVMQAFLQAGRGLEAAHSAGLVHGDFKPANVLMHDEQAMVLDFAGTPQAGDPAPCTPSYMSPEQLYGAKPDAAADQFAFCVALYEALCGHPPFDSRTARLKGAICPPERPISCVDLRRAIGRGLASDPAARHPNLGPLLAQLTITAQAAFA